MSTQTGYRFFSETEESFVAESLFDGHQVTVYYDKIRKPRKHSPSELLKAGVLLDPSGAGIKMTCIFCGEEWYPNIRSGGHYYRNAWKCFHGCHDNL